jgi:hypothetical protein
MSNESESNVVELKPKRKAPAKKKAPTTKKAKTEDLGLTRAGKKRKNATGRKPKIVEDEETLEQIEGLARIQATKYEMAAFFKVTEKTFLSFVQSSKKAQEVIETGYGHGKASLRRLQFKQAQNSTTMAIWLGKQYLGQTDKVEEKASHKHSFVEDAATDFDSRIAGILARTATSGDPKITH